MTNVKRVLKWIGIGLVTVSGVGFVSTMFVPLPFNLIPIIIGSVVILRTIRRREQKKDQASHLGVKA